MREPHITELLSDVGILRYSAAEECKANKEFQLYLMYNVHFFVSRYISSGRRQCLR